jgi:hypothetical protein
MATQPLSLTSQVIAYNDAVDLRDKTASSTYQGATLAEVLALSPASADTTYDLASAQDGANVDITLTGSDATADTVQLTAGTNITLTETAGSITIDAAGGSAGPLVFRCQLQPEGLSPGQKVTPTYVFENTLLLDPTWEWNLGGGTLFLGDDAAFGGPELATYLGVDPSKVWISVTAVRQSVSADGIQGIGVVYSNTFGAPGNPWIIGINGVQENATGGYVNLNVEILLYP